MSDMVMGNGVVLSFEDNLKILIDTYNLQVAALDRVTNKTKEQKAHLKDLQGEVTNLWTSMGALNSLMAGLGGAMDVSAFMQAGEAMKAFKLDPGNIEKEIEANKGIIEARNAFYTQLGEMSTQFLVQELAKKEDSIRREAATELELLKNSRRYKRMTDKQKEAEEKKIRDKANKELNANFKNQKLLSIAQIGIDTARAVMGIWADVPKVDFGVSATALTAMVIGLGAAQAAMVSQQSAPKLSRGGDFIVPPGYNNDSFPMFVESGERVQVTPRSEVGGTAGGDQVVSINFTGNVLSQDFIEDEAIPMIKEAIRRGADIGVA